MFGVRYVPIGANMLAHRASWIIANGPLPPRPDGHHGWVVMHTCDNPGCVNPAHLRLGGQADNVADMDQKARANRLGMRDVGGGRSPRAALSADQVARIIMGSKSDREFASEFGVHPTTIKRVRLGESYKREAGGGLRLNRRFSAAGELNPGSKLTYEQVKLIRTSAKSTYELAAELGVTQPCVASARRGATYTDVDVPCPPKQVGRKRLIR